MSTNGCRCPPTFPDCWHPNGTWLFIGQYCKLPNYPAKLHKRLLKIALPIGEDKNRREGHKYILTYKNKIHPHFIPENFRMEHTPAFSVYNNEYLFAKNT